MRTAIVASLLVLTGCGAKLPEIDNPTPVLPDAEAPTVFTRAYGLTESPDGKIRVFAKEERDYTHLYEMRKQADGSWSDPVQLEFPARIKLTTPSFSHSDGALYYASDADIFERGQRDANLWRVEPTEDGWGEPKPLDPSINTGADQLNPAMGKDGRLYFTDNGYDSSGAHDIFMAERGGADEGAAKLGIGGAAGVLATRLMRIEADIPTTMLIGIVGALIGGMLLRFLVTVMGWLSGFVGAVLGALLVIWIWQTYLRR